jgi:hypothetical protein
VRERVKVVDWDILPAAAVTVMVDVDPKVHVELVAMVRVEDPPAGGDMVVGLKLYDVMQLGNPAAVSASGL